MKKAGKLLIICIWIFIIYLLFKLNLFSASMNDVNKFISRYSQYKTLIFVLLSTIRVAALIPGAVFMIIGGIIFNPIEGIFLTLISIILSETIVYWVSRFLIGSKIEEYLINKYPNVYKALRKNNSKLLSIGIICPIAPSDAACFMASSTGLSYFKFILIVAISNLPMMFLYGFLGNSIVTSFNNTIVIASMIIAVAAYSIYAWNRAQKQTNVL